MNNNFNEKDHPRDKDGKFTSGNGAQSDAYKELSAEELKAQLQKELPEEPASKKKSMTQEEFFGEEFKGVKGAVAIDKLLKEKRGHVKNAFMRPEIGGIDLVWGNEGGGLLHTIKKRDKLLAQGKGHISGLDMVKKIPEIVEKGVFSIDERGRPGFNFDNYRVAVRPTYDGEKLNWVISAMENLQ